MGRVPVSSAPVRRDKNRGSRLSAAICLVALLSGLVIAATAFGDETVVVDEPVAGPEPSPGLFEGATGEQLNAEMETALAEDRADEQWLDSEAAAEEREASQTAYVNETGPEAEALLGEQFEDVLNGLNGDPARVLSDLPVEEVLSPNIVRIPDQDGTGGSELVESTMPVSTRILGGAPEPVDLTLQHTGDTFVSENPLTEVALPESSEGSVDLPGDVKITNLPGNLPVHASRFGDKDLFYPETDTDTDTLITPISRGVEIFSQLRSPESPENLRFELTLPKGAALAADGEGAAIQTPEGSTIRIPAPTAVDAQGVSVPVEMSVEEDALQLHVRHRQAEVAYPILVDPPFLTEEYPWSWNYWQGMQEGGGPAYGHWINSSGMHINSLGSETKQPPGNYHYYFQPPGETSYVSAVEFGSYLWQFHNCPAVQPHMYMGIANTDGSWARLETHGGNLIYSEPGWESGWVGHPGSRWAVAGVGTTVESQLKCAHELDVAGATVQMDDNDPPSVGTPSGPGKPVGSSPAPITVSASDSGLGLSAIRVEASGSDVGHVFPAPSGASECGYYSVPCSAGWSGTININPSQLPEGNVTLTVKAIDAVENWSTKTTTITVDHTPPGTVIDTGPASNAAITGPTATFTFHATEASSTFECKLDSASYAACSGSGYTTPTLSSGAHELQIRATDQAGNTNSSPTRRSFYVGAPDTTIDSGPSGVTNDDTPTFAYHATQAGATFECKIDSAAFTDCSSEGFTSASLGNGTHTFQVRAVNTGLTDATPASRAFTVDTIPPTLDIVGGPTGPTNQTTPTFTFTKEAGATATCSIDTGSSNFGACSGSTTDQPSGPLGQQTYSFRVRESDAAGNESPAVKRSFTVDTVPPQTTIESGPTGVTADAFPEFSFDSSEPDAGFKCRLDSKQEEACGGEEYVASEVPDGKHTLFVAAKDEAGNVDPTPAARTFTVDATGPSAAIQSGPSGPTANSLPTFVFSTEAGATIDCAITADTAEFDIADYGSCSTATSDTPAKALDDGGYTFHLLATDSVDNENTVTRHFSVDTTPPETSITSGPEGATDDTQPTFAFSASEGKVKYECKLDGSSFGPCSGPGATNTPASTLNDGEHTFAVRAIDKVGTADATPASRSFTVDTKKPQTTIESGPSGPTVDSTPAFSYASSEPGTFQCKVDSAAFSSCPTGNLEVESVPDGQHTLTVRALDQASNPDPTPAQRTFVVDTGAPSTPVTSGQLRDPETPGVDLHVEVADGSSKSPTTLRSGVKTITISVDGVSVYSDEMPCVGAWHTCPDHLMREIELPYQNVIGTHLFEVESTDAVGHQAQAAWIESTPQEGTVAEISNADECGTPTAQGVTEPNNHTLRGGPGADLIISNPHIDTIYGGGGCDVIIGSLSSETIRGEAGNDLIRGNRSDDEIYGGPGNDEIFGGIGDDKLYGEGGNDYIDGGPGADKEMGETGDDTIRGGQGIDKLAGQADTDTVSFADAVGPGFPSNGGSDAERVTKPAILENLAGVAGFPGGEKTGVFVNLNGPPDGQGQHRNYAHNGGGGSGGGLDYLYIPDGEHPDLPGEAPVKVEGSFEKVVGSPFADLIRGSQNAETIWGGPGPDVIRGGGGTDVLNGGIDGDFLDGSGSAEKMVGGDSEKDRCVAAGSATVQACGSTEDRVVPRDLSKVALGIQDPDSESHESIFINGSPQGDRISANYPSAHEVTFSVDTTAAVAANVCKKDKTGENSYRVTCNLGEKKLGSVVMMGGAGDDKLEDGDLDRTRPGSVEMLGGAGTDTLNGSSQDELLFDGKDQSSGREELHGGGGDDVLLQGEGSDKAEGGNGNDLLMSANICENDAIIGDENNGDKGRDNAQFHPVDVGVFADLAGGHLGETAQNEHKCKDGGFEPLHEINDLEGSPYSDIFEGNKEDNLLIGRGKPDVLKGFGGQDTLNARDTKHDNVINCGGQSGDRAHIDAGQDNEQEAEAHCDKVDHGGEAFISATDSSENLSTEAEDAPSGFQSASTSVLSPTKADAYPLDESSGVVVDNTVEGQNDGLYKNANIGSSGNSEGPELGAASAMLGDAEGSGVELDGVNDYIELGEEPEPEPEPEAESEDEGAEGYSIELWVKFEQAPTEKEYLYSGMAEEEGPFLYRAADGTITFGTHTEEGTPEVSAPEPIEDGEWHQVVGTLEGEEIALYVDGFPHRMNYGQPVIDEESAPEEEVVGSSGAQSHFLDGTVDDVTVYDGALEEGEVVHQLASSKAEAPETILVPTPDPSDTDGDSIPDNEDNCVEVPNENQADSDLDGIGDACLPPDADGDTVPDAQDNCVNAYNPEQQDLDKDGLGAECDESEPLLSTKAATGIAATTATLNATINPEGKETTYYFEVGTSTSYGTTIPASPKSAGAGVDEVAASEAVSGLEPGTTYHFRVAASSEGATVKAQDQTFETKSFSETAAKLGGMTVVEPFDGGSASLASFGSNWSTLGWAGGTTPKGSDTTAGWRPVDAYATVNGTFYNPSFADAGWGVGAAVTLATNPGLASRYFSLWLDMQNPSATTRSGYELRFTNVSTNTYTVTLSKWVEGTQTQLATKSSYSFVNGNSFAIVDLGGTVSAWTNTGSGYSQLLSAADSAFSSGKAGIEGSGNNTRLSQFKAGVLKKFATVSSEAATGVKTTTATLNGTVNPEGAATTYQFEYGTTTSYGSKAPASPASAGSGTSGVAVSEALGGLSPGTTYHYRVVATSDAGTSYGEDKTLVTLKPPKAGTDVASELKATTATLNGTVNPEGAATTYQFEYGTTTAYGSKAPASPASAGSGTEAVGVSQGLSGLSAGTLYHYRGVASSEAGTTYGEDQTFETRAVDTAAKLGGMAVVEPFDGGSTSLANFGSNWSTLGWAGGTTPKGSDTTTGWGPSNAYATVNGTFYNPSFADSGWGLGAAVTMATNPANASRYFSLWLDIQNPSATTRSGYELRFTNVSTNTYTVTLSKWVEGTQTQLATKSSYSFVNGNSFAIVDLGGTVSAWTNTGSGYSQLLSAVDSAFSSGKAGLEGSGNITRLNKFKVGVLNLPKATTEAATKVGPTQATLNGLVNPEGVATTYQFEYGTTTSYGSKAPASPASAGSGTDAVGVSQDLIGLSQGTTYHYRVVASNEAGTSYGEDRTLTTPAPTYQSSFGSAGTGGGQFAHPAGSAVDASGNLWVVDQNNYRVEKFSAAGEYLTKFGSSGSGNGQFSRPTDIAVDAKGSLWVTDAGNSRVEKFSAAGEYLTKFGSPGSGNGQFSGPESLAIDAKGNIWVGDTYNGRLQEFNENGEFIKVVGSYGTGQGQLIEPTGIDIGLNGNVWVADWGNQRVAEFSESGGFIRQFGTEGTGKGQFKRPDVIEVDSKGQVWVGDQNNERLQLFNEAGEYITQFGTAGSGAGQFSFGWPMGISSDEKGNLWISDTGNNRVQKWTYGP